MNSKQELQVREEPALHHYAINTILPFKFHQSSSRKERKYQRDGHWNERQKLKYTIFLTFFQELFNDPLKKKSVRIYDMMADMIITRNSNQCRSHHQKMEKYRTTITDIIASVAEKYEPRVYKEMEEKYLVFIKVLLEDYEKYTRSPPCYERSNHPEKKRNAKVKIMAAPVPIIYEPTVLGGTDFIDKIDGSQKNKEGNVKTSSCYNQGNEQVRSKDMAEQIPMMTLSDPKINEGEGMEGFLFPNQSYSMCYRYQASFGQAGLIFLEGESTLESKSYYEEQIRVLEVKRQWHIHNAQLLSVQMANEKQSIQNCDAALELYQLALNATTN